MKSKVSNGLCVLLGVILIVSGVVKLFQIKGFENTVQMYLDAYFFSVGASMVYVLALLVCICEMVSGFLCVVRFRCMFPRIIVAVILGAFVVITFINVFYPTELGTYTGMFLFWYFIAFLSNGSICEKCLVIYNANYIYSTMQKKLIYNLITILVLVCSCSPVFSQSQNPSKAKGEVRIGGSVTDSFTNIGLPAFVTLLGADSAVVDTATCHVYQGFSSFRLYIPKVSGTYTLRAEYDGYHTAEVKENFDFSKPQRGYGFPDVKLKRKANAEDSLRSVGLGEVVVRGTRLQVAYRGDTLVYNAEAFNIPEGAMLDALVRQLPGAELKANGDVYINGKRLDYITLNGNDFFKGKNKVILENLPTSR